MSTRAPRAVRGQLVEGPRSLGSSARAKRWHLFLERFPDLGQMRILDVGGTVDSWIRAPMRPEHVVLLNVADENQADVPGWASVRNGDACDPPADLRAARFDLVYSNSVLEHVGGYVRRVQMAEQVRTWSPHHWVQTPNRYFPIEPHWLFPGFQFLPARFRAAIYMRWPLAHTPPPNREAALRSVLETELVGRTELSLLFPRSDILRERIGPFTKSLIVVR